MRAAGPQRREAGRGAPARLSRVDVAVTCCYYPVTRLEVIVDPCPGRYLPSVKKPRTWVLQNMVVELGHLLGLAVLTGVPVVIVAAGVKAFAGDWVSSHWPISRDTSVAVWVLWTWMMTLAWFIYGKAEANRLWRERMVRQQELQRERALPTDPRP